MSYLKSSGNEGVEGCSSAPSVGSMDHEEGICFETVKDDCDPFKKSEKIVRSPLNDTNEDGKREIEYLEEDIFMTPRLGVGKTKKRKASSPAMAISDEADLYWKTVEGKIKELHSLTKTFTNTKSEIKRAAEALFNMANRMSMLRKTNYQEILTEEVGVQTQQMRGKIEKAETQMCTRCRRAIEEETLNIEEKIESAGTDEEINCLIECKWPTEVFKKTKVKNGNPFTGEKTEVENIILITGEEDDSALFKEAIKRFPEIKMMQEEDQEEIYGAEENEEGEKLHYKLLESIVKVGRRTITNKVYHVCTDLESIAFEALKAIMAKSNEERIGLAATEKFDWSKLRKLTEINARQMQKEVDFFIPKERGRHNKIQSQLMKEIQNNKEINIEIPFGKKEEHDNLVRKIKAEVKIQEGDAEVISISKTKEANIKLIVNEKKEGAANQIYNEIRNSIGEEVRMEMRREKGRFNLKTLILRGLDTTVTKDELQEDLKKILNVVDEIKVVSLKPIHTGAYQTALIELDIVLANKMSNEGRIRIGWSSVRVEEIIKPIRCFKCLSFGHRSYQCTNENERAGACYKCGQVGHRINECLNQAFCGTCSQEGHRSDSMACPCYRKIVEETRKERRRQQSYNL